MYGLSGYYLHIQLQSWENTCIAFRASLLDISWYRLTQRQVHHASYTGCPGWNVPEFGRMFPTLKYTDLTQNTYIRSWTVTEIMAREKSGLLAVPRTVPDQLMRYPYTADVRPWEWNAVNEVGLYQNAHSAMLNQYFSTAGYACAM